MNDLISRKWLMECVEEGWIKFETQKDENRFIHLVRDIAPSAQPVAKDIYVPAKDCISRQAAIDALNDVLADYIPCLIGRNEEIPLKCAVAIRDLPSAQRWIPVTKRLPENDDECLTILEDGLYYVQAYSDGEWYYDDVVAWMPLPKPWEGDAP